MPGIIGWLMGDNVKVIRGDELLRPGHVSTKWVCSDHGPVVPVMVARGDEVYEACRQCLYASPDIQQIEELAEEVDERTP